ncbi:MAG: 50S ribosomal protein L5 [Patescibacteria group bacterium]|nr:50S ribosomal protein L5 [Patescibacteria group bacterium]MDE2015566.1 50S ribosomal protein L5 [Patescibacteria group bacterium]MDE2227238.1 50S ribosomal protein L5 [Patescibacteria group bacterium]
MKQEHKQQNNEVAGFLEKIVVNVGIGRLSAQPNFEEKGLPQITRDIASACGQMPQVRRAKKSIAGFKTREGQIIGLRATLRRRKMVDFFERLTKIVLPRVKDFRGLERSIIDDGGTLNIGLREQFVFPEINPEESQVSFPLGINLVPKEKNREKAVKKFLELGVPLKK